MMSSRPPPKLTRPPMAEESTQPAESAKEETPLPPVHLARVHVWLRRLSEASEPAGSFIPLELAEAHLHEQAAAEGKRIHLSPYCHTSFARFIMAYPQLYELKEEELESGSNFFYRNRPKPKEEVAEWWQA